MEEGEGLVSRLPFLTSLYYSLHQLEPIRMGTTPNPNISHTTVYTQEIIQNADDAGASTVHFYLDSRRHGSQSLIHPSLEHFQGPALLSYNDAVFQEKDWQSIQDMQQSVKAEDPFKVGKFGIGFNSVYHITGMLLWDPLDKRHCSTTCRVKNKR